MPRSPRPLSPLSPCIPSPARSRRPSVLPAALAALCLLAPSLAAHAYSADPDGQDSPNRHDLQLSPASLTFAPLTAGTAASPQALQITNDTGHDISPLKLALAGDSAGLFTVSSNCSPVLAAHSSCTAQIGFSPLVPGSYRADLVLLAHSDHPLRTVPLSGTATPSAITIDTTNPADWKISNGAINIDWSSTRGNIFGITLAGHTDQLIDTTNTSGGIPKGFYMDNAGFGSSTPTASYTNNGNYLDWSITYPSNSHNAYTYTEHFIVVPNDPGIHVYFTAVHSASDIAGSIGQVQWVYRDSLTQFTNTYAVNPSINSPGAYATPLPSSSEMFSTVPGRQVQDATVDLHGFTDIPAGFTRRFYTKYDFAGYEYLHKAHGLYGSTYGVWTVLPRKESLVGGPTKQMLDFTGNLLMVEAYSNHEDNGLSLRTPAGTASSRLFGPFYVHFNTFGTAYSTSGEYLATPADMYRDAVQAGRRFLPFYDTEQQLVAAGYVPSTARGSVSIQVKGVARFDDDSPRTAWAVLSDPNKNFQYSSSGFQYWADISRTGSAIFHGVAPGTYRLSVYVLGQWGELRQDNITVTANQSTTVPTLAFQPENFGPTPPLFTIGTPDRSSHEFLHGHTSATYSPVSSTRGDRDDRSDPDHPDARDDRQPSTIFPDDRQFWGAWNYWADFASTQGAVLYNGTSGPNGPATNDPLHWNYTHWRVFDPSLYAAVYNSSDQGKDGYTYAIPPYVASLPGHSGTNGVTTPTPPWQVHFATPSSQSGSQSGRSPANFVVLSVAMACSEGSYVVTLNGQQLIWHETNASDCMLRSGLSGYTQWAAFQWPASALSPAGQDNTLTISVSQTGVSDDALRLELTPTSADPALTHWNDYTFVSSSTYTPPNDTLPNP